MKYCTNCGYRLVSAGLDLPGDDALEVFIENDGPLYRQVATPLHRQMVIRMAEGKYDPRAAVKAWMYLVDAGARKYLKEFGEGEDWAHLPWNKVFPKKQREKVARFLRDTFETEAKLGNYDHFLPSKHTTLKSRFSLTAAAGPHTLLRQLYDEYKKGTLDLDKWGFAMGHTKGADYIVGAGEAIVGDLIDFQAGRLSADRALDRIKKNIKKALQDNAIFKGKRAEQSHDIWTEYVRRSRGKL